MSKLATFFKLILPMSSAGLGPVWCSTCPLMGEFGVVLMVGGNLGDDTHSLDRHL